MTPQPNPVGAQLLVGRRNRIIAGLAGDEAPCIVCGAAGMNCTGDEAYEWISEHSAPDRYVVVQNDVWVKRPSPGAPNRPMTTLAAARGQRKPLSEVLLLVTHGYDVHYVDDRPAPVLPESLAPSAVGSPGQGVSPPVEVPVVDAVQPPPGAAIDAVQPPTEGVIDAVQPPTEGVIEAAPLPDPPVAESVEPPVAASVEPAAESEEELPAALRSTEPKAKGKRTS